MDNLADQFTMNRNIMDLHYTNKISNKSTGKKSINEREYTIFSHTKKLTSLSCSDM